MLGDGEIQEGQIWEAAMFGAFHKLDNVVAIVDYNRIQLDGFVKDIMEMEPLVDKWQAFGWHTIELDGHDIPALQAAFAEAAAIKGKPTALIAHTVKGKGVSFMENNPKFHGVAPTQGGSGTRAEGACLMADRNEIRTQAGDGDPRGVRQGAGGAGPGEPEHLGGGRRPLEIHLHLIFRQGVSGPLRLLRHRRGEHGRAWRRAWPPSARFRSRRASPASS